MNPDVRVFPDASELSRRAAEAAVATLNDAAASTGSASLVLSGGGTPRLLHRLLASQFRDRIPWAQVHVFWGDERYVPHGDERSNYLMAKVTLLDHVPCPVGNVHPMPTHLPAPDDAAQAYEATLSTYFAGGPPRFDLTVLGLGADGHTASLFPRSAALHERRRWVVAVTAPAEPPSRLTLTLPVLTRSVRTFVLVSGSDKAHALHHVLAANADAEAYPAAALRSGKGTVIWWADRDAAEPLSE